MTRLPAEYGPLLNELHRRAAVRGQPVNGTFELTHLCNLACGMCYIPKARSARNPRRKELSASAWLRLARDVVDNGLVFLLLTGGEVLVRKDFFEIYTPLTRMGLIITLFTNGTLITDTVAQRLAQSPPHRTEITLYGASARTYEAVTGVPGSYARCCSGIEALLERRVPLALKATISRRNVDELASMRRMAHNWGVPFSASWLLTPQRNGGDSNIQHWRLPAQECVVLESTDGASAAEWTEAALRGPSDVPDSNFYCHAGRVAFAIGPSGDMSPCVDLELPAVHPLEVGFSAAWQQVQQFVNTAPALSPVCAACIAREYCPRCPAWSLLEAHSLTEPVPYLCEIAQARRRWYERPA